MKRAKTVHSVKYVRVEQRNALFHSWYYESPKQRTACGRNITSNMDVRHHSDKITCKNCIITNNRLKDNAKEA